jgi:hypothetical protein
MNMQLDHLLTGTIILRHTWITSSLCYFLNSVIYQVSSESLYQDTKVPSYDYFHSCTVYLLV